MVKGPRKPRGRMSSYACFVQKFRAQHRRKHPNAVVNFFEFSQKCSDRWRIMSMREKKKFNEMAKRDKRRYDREMKNYVPPRKRRARDPNAPKRPMTAFFLFGAATRRVVKSKHPDYSVIDIARKLGQMWNNLPSKRRQTYEKRAAKLNSKYKRAVVAYRRSSRR